METHKSNKVICLEGIVGAGKTTQAELLFSYLFPRCFLMPELNEIYPMKEIREELRKSGKISCLSKEDVLKIVEARGQIHRHLLESTKKPVILMDRGIYTGMVFESGPLSIWDVEKMSIDSGVVVPDICFVLHCDAEKALQRVDERRVKVGKYEHRAFHENEDYINWTRERYFEIAKQRDLILIDTSGSLAEIQAKIRREVYNAGIL